jgi:hypothetical protein
LHLFYVYYTLLILFLHAGWIRSKQAIFPAQVEGEGSDEKKPVPDILDDLVDLLSGYPLG